VGGGGSPADDGLDIRRATSAITGADAAQAAQRGHRIPPPPPIGILGKTYLWIVAGAASFNAALQFSAGHTALGFVALIAGLIGYWIAVRDRQRNTSFPLGEPRVPAAISASAAAPLHPPEVGT
jgi:hypothetical protein